MACINLRERAGQIRGPSATASIASRRATGTEVVICMIPKKPSQLGGLLRRGSRCQQAVADRKQEKASVQLCGESLHFQSRAPAYALLQCGTFFSIKLPLSVWQGTFSRFRTLDKPAFETFILLPKTRLRCLCLKW